MGIWLPKQTLALIGLGIFLYCLTGPNHPLLVYDAAAIHRGEWWRLFSGHWVHTSWTHLSLDALALLVLGGIMEKHNKRLVLPSMLIGMIAVNGMLWGLEVERYCGLSGALHAFIIPMVFCLWRKRPSIFLPLFVFGSVLKMLYEISQQQTLFMHNDWAPIIESHLAGYVGGLLLVLAIQIYRRVFLVTYTTSKQCIISEFQYSAMIKQTILMNNKNADNR